MSFSHTLSIADRRRLRAVIRKVHLAHYPTEKLTDIVCDQLIDAWGPEVAGEIVRKAVDRGMVG